MYQAEEILEIAYKGFQELCKEMDFNPQDISVVGISCIGNIDYQTGTVFFAPQFQWHKVELGEMARKKFGLPVFVENDMKSSLIGLSHRRQDIRYEDVTYLSIGTGVGAAVMYGGNIVRGSDNAAGEVGHIILESSGRLCDCGCTGCVQTYLCPWASPGSRDMSSAMWLRSISHTGRRSNGLCCLWKNRRNIWQRCFETWFICIIHGIFL